jgi:hypothetical protein
MIPEYGSKKFQCPHCNTVATQEWFTANNASNTASSILNHLYLNYRASIDEYSQGKVVRFVKEIENNY